MIQSMKNKLSLKAKSGKGFTLAELLIVVAIIAILIAIAIPLFSSQLNSAKKAADDANFRSAKAVAVGLEIQALDGTLPTTTPPATGHTFDAKKGEFTGVKTDAYKAQTDDTASGRVRDEVITLSIDAATKSYTIEWKS